ncbi:MAG: pectate lyase [Nibricoccus sp.]
MVRLTLCLIALSISVNAHAESSASATTTIDTRGFRSGSSHWRNINEPNRVIQPLADQPVYAPSQIAEIAANIRLFQRDNGGWPKDYDMLAVLTPEQVEAVRASHDRSDTSFDNGNIHSQVDYLAKAFTALGNPADRDACLRGFDFMLAAQYPNGGFPQRWPKPKGFPAHITFNDGVMIGILNVFEDAATNAPHFAWLDDARREKARSAVQRGIECILKCQIRVDDQLTGWCQQHDEKTFAPASARTFELASCCPQDTTEICRFLMRATKPAADVRQAIESAATWLKKVQLDGIRVEKAKAEHVEFYRHKTDDDFVVVTDKSAPPLWARHYEIGTDRPIFASRDGVKVYSFAELDRERRTGTPWYGSWPLKLLEDDYPLWKASLTSVPKTERERSRNRSRDAR